MQLTVAGEYCPPTKARLQNLEKAKWLRFGENFKGDIIFTGVPLNILFTGEYCPQVNVLQGYIIRGGQNSHPHRYGDLPLRPTVGKSTPSDVRSDMIS